MIETAAQALKKLEETQSKVKDLIEYYRKIQTISLPDLIIEIGDDVDIATEFLVKKLPKEEFAKWNTRASKLENINEALADFEYGIVDELTLSSSRIFVTEIYKVFGLFEWFLGHIGEITLALAVALGATSGYYGDDLERGAKKIWGEIMKADFKEALKSTVRSVLPIEKAIYEGAQIAFIGILVTLVESVLVSFSAAKFSLQIAPVLALKAATEKELQDKAFPQGKGRVRRRKSHRIRAK